MIDWSAYYYLDDAGDVDAPWSTPTVEVSGLWSTLFVAPVAEHPATPLDGSGMSVTLYPIGGGGGGGAVLVHANVGDVTSTLNQSDTATFSAPKWDVSTAFARPVVTGARITFNGSILFDGPVMTRSASSGDGLVSFTARGYDWFLEKRLLGMPPEEPYLANGGFDDGLAGWWPDPGDGSISVTSTPALGGTKSAKLTWVGPPTSDFADAKPPNLTVAYTSPAPFMGRWSADAWLYIDHLAANVGDGRVMRIRGVPGTETWVSLPADVPAKKWTRVSGSCLVGPGGTVQITLFGPGGEVCWDQVRLYDDGSWGPVGWHADTAEVAGIAITSAQVRSDVGLGSSTPASGKLWPEAEWPVGQHTSWQQIVKALAAYDDGFDWSVEVGGGAPTWTAHVPTKGSASGVSLSPGESGGISSYSWSEDGTTLVSALVVQGAGPDGSQTEDSYTDLGLFGGIELDGVAQADEGTPIDDLRKKAEKWVTGSDAANDQLTVTCHPRGPDVITGVVTGDTVSVAITDGVVAVGGTWRVIAKTVRGRGLTTDLTLVRAT